MILIGGFGGYILHFTKDKVPSWAWYIYCFIFFFVSFINILMFISDPGMVKKLFHFQDEETGSNNLEPMGCSICGIKELEENTKHCSLCDICIQGYDHHCIFLGKCIGKKNLILFYMYVGLVPIFFWGTIIMCAVTLN